MRDAYILDLRTVPVAASEPAARLRGAAESLAALHAELFTGRSPLSWISVAAPGGPVARSLGLMSGLSARVATQDTGAGSGLSAVAAAARAVTSGFEAVAAAVAVGESVPPVEWPAALHERFTRVSPQEAQRLALTRAELDVDDVVEGIDARRAARVEQGHDTVALELVAGLPQAPDHAGVGVVMMAGHTEIREHGWKTRARITSVVQGGLDPALGPAGAAYAAEQALHRLHLRPEELDFVQVDARAAGAPAVVAKALGLAPDRVNPMGGVLSDGAAGAATGIIELQRLLDALEAADRRFGMVVGLEPMGGATAVVVDRQFYM